MQCRLCDDQFLSCAKQLGLWLTREFLNWDEDNFLWPRQQLVSENLAHLGSKSSPELWHKTLVELHNVWAYQYRDHIRDVGMQQLGWGFLWSAGYISQNWSFAASPTSPFYKIRTFCGTLTDFTQTFIFLGACCGKLFWTFVFGLSGCFSKRFPSETWQEMQNFCFFQMTNWWFWYTSMFRKLFLPSIIP